MTDCSGVKIVVAEDHALTRLAVKLMLQQYAEFDIVAEANNGNTAVAKTLELHPAVVLMDIGMPILDGIEATKKIKEVLPATRVLMFTSHDDLDEFAAAMAAGADGYLLKECSPSQLFMAITTVLDQEASPLSPLSTSILRGDTPKQTKQQV